MEIVLKIRNNKTEPVIKITPTQIQTNNQDYYEVKGQPTIQEELEDEDITDEITPEIPTENEVGPTLTEDQSKEAIRTNEKTGGFHNFINPEDMGEPESGSE